MDVTYAKGALWEGLEYAVEGYTGDFLQLPPEWTNTIDVLVFDPPHITEAGRTSRYYGRFGVEHEDVQHRADICHLFPPFLAEATRVLRRRGILLTKLKDQVHRGRYRWQQVDFINAVRAQKGLVACDMFVREGGRSDTLVGPNWKVVRHSRRGHLYWMVARKGRC